MATALGVTFVVLVIAGLARAAVAATGPKVSVPLPAPGPAKPSPGPAPAPPRKEPLPVIASATAPLKDRTPEVRDVQRMARDRWGLGAFVGDVDGLLGQRTWNFLCYALGKGWWSRSAQSVVAEMAAKSKVVTTQNHMGQNAMKHLALPAAVKQAQVILGIRPDGFLGPGTWKSLDAALPGWQNRPWRNVPDGVVSLLSTRGGVA